MGARVSWFVIEPVLVDSDGLDHASPTCFQGGINFTCAEFNPASASAQRGVFDNAPVVMCELIAKVGANQFGIVRMDDKRRVSGMRMEDGDRLLDYGKQ